MLPICVPILFTKFKFFRCWLLVFNHPLSWSLVHGGRGGRGGGRGGRLLHWWLLLLLLLLLNSCCWYSWFLFLSFALRMVAMWTSYGFAVHSKCAPDVHTHFAMLSSGWYWCYLFCNVKDLLKIRRNSPMLFLVLISHPCDKKM